MFPGWEELERVGDVWLLEGQGSEQLWELAHAQESARFCRPKHLILQSRGELSTQNTSASGSGQNSKLSFGSVCHTGNPPSTPQLWASKETPPWLSVFLKLQTWAVKPSSQLVLSQHPLAIRNHHVTPESSCDRIRQTCRPTPRILCSLVWYPKRFMARVFFLFFGFLFLFFKNNTGYK